MWSTTLTDQQPRDAINLLQSLHRRAAVSSPQTSPGCPTTPIHLVVVEHVSEEEEEEDEEGAAAAAAEMEYPTEGGRESPDTYDWSLTYRRLRRASSMM